MDHEKYMQRCFHLAIQGAGQVAPNPLVGAVLVEHDKIIAEGYHQKFGGPHAEVVALNQISNAQISDESILYINLEPCSHTGKTPPCTERILSAGIRNVVISNRDPFPQVNGSGFRKLKEAGVKVTEGVLQNEGELVNRRFFTFHKQKRPYIILKWAQTANCFIAPAPTSVSPKITWISNETSRLLVHEWRSQEQAILVGRGTVTADDPRLSVRELPGKSPVRITLDPKLALTPGYQIFDNSVRTMIFNTVKNEVQENTSWIKIQNGDNMIPGMLEKLYEEKIQSVIVEGGATTLNHFLKMGMWDEARVFISKHEFEHGVAAPMLNRAPVSQQEIDGDLLFMYTNHSPT